MLWYWLQFWLLTVISFALGLALGWAAWKLPWRRHVLTESGIAQQIQQRYRSSLAEKDTEIARLRSALERSEYIRIGSPNKPEPAAPRLTQPRPADPAPSPSAPEPSSTGERSQPSPWAAPSPNPSFRPGGHDE